jgi:hypothetical protein
MKVEKELTLVPGDFRGSRFAVPVTLHIHTRVLEVWFKFVRIMHQQLYSYI